MSTPDNVSPPTYSLTINGVDRTSHVEDTTWTINQQWSRQGDTATIYLTDEHSTNPISLGFYVPPLAQVVLTDTSLGQTLFSGVASFPEVQYSGPNLAYWQVGCTDWTYLGDRSTVFGDFQNQRADQIVSFLCAQSGSGITTSNVQMGPVINRIQINYMPLTAALTKVCQYASFLTTYGWYIDENHDLHFNDQTQAGAIEAKFSDLPSDFASGTYVPGFTGGYATDFKYDWDATSIRNSITILGGNYSNTYTDMWLGNGTQFSWPLTYTPDKANFGTATLTVGGVTATVSVQSGSSATTQWVVVQNVSGQWFLTTNTDPAPGAAVAVSLLYPYLAPVVSQVQSATSIAEFSALPNGGVFGEIITDTTLLNILAAQGRGRRELNTYGLPDERVVFNSNETFTGHVRAGQLIEFKNQFIQDSANSYLPGIDDTFMVLQNRISGSMTGFRTYSITAARVNVGGGP